MARVLELTNLRKVGSSLNLAPLIFELVSRFCSCKALPTAKEVNLKHCVLMLGLSAKPQVLAASAEPIHYHAIPP